MGLKLLSFKGMYMTKKLEGLTRSELRVLHKILQGKPYKQIAKELFVVEETIKFHMASIKKKSNQKTLAQVIVHYFDMLPYLEKMDFRMEKEKDESY